MGKDADIMAGKVSKDMGLIDIVVEVMFWVREVRRKLIWRI